MFYEVGLTSVLCGAFDRAIGARDAIFTLEEKLNLPSARIGFEQIDMRITNRRGKNHPFAEQTRIFRKLALLSLSQSFLPARHFVKFIIRDL